MSELTSIPDRLPPAGKGVDSDKPPGARTARLVVLAAALVVVLLGFLLGAMGLLLAVVESGGAQSTTVTLVVSFTFLTVGLGSLLAWQVWGSLRGRPSRPFQPRRTWPWVILYAAAVLLGQVVLSGDVAAVLLFPPLHVAATILPAIIILVAAGKALCSIASRRQMVFQVSSGAFLSMLLSLALQVAVGLGFLVVSLAVVALRPGGPELMDSLIAALQNPAVLRNPASFLPLFTSPLAILVLLVFVAGIVPLIEESVKTMGVGLLIHRHPTMARAFLWGLASGAGFAMAEGLFNAGGVFEGWAPVVLTRVGVTLLHCFTGGLMGMAWAYAFVKARWPRALGLFLGSWALHGLWNALALAQAFLSLSPVDEHMTVEQQAMASLGMVGLLGALGLMVLGMVFGLVRVTAHLKGQSQS